MIELPACAWVGVQAPPSGGQHDKPFSSAVLGPLEALLEDLDPAVNLVGGGEARVLQKQLVWSHHLPVHIPTGADA